MAHRHGLRRDELAFCFRILNFAKKNLEVHHFSKDSFLKICFVPVILLCFLSIKKTVFQTSPGVQLFIFLSVLDVNLFTDSFSSEKLRRNSMLPDGHCSK